MQGILKHGMNNKINSLGKSYDTKLYTFKEMDYNNDWTELKIEVLPAVSILEVIFTFLKL